MIVLNTISSSVRLYGQCSHPTRIKGDFTIAFNGTSYAVTLSEGHVNRPTPQRVVTFIDPTANWSASDRFSENNVSAVDISNSAGRFTFIVERAALAVEGSSAEQATPDFFQGKTVFSIGGEVEEVNVHEIHLIGNRKFSLNAPLPVLLKVRHQIQETGDCQLREADAQT